MIGSRQSSTEIHGNIGAAIQFALMIELDNRDTFRGIIEVFDVELIAPDLADNVMRRMERLTDLGNIEDGWHDGEGSAPSDEAIKVARTFLRQRPSLAGAFSVFPTLAGGVLFEFEVHGWNYSVEIGADGGLEFFGIQIEGPEELETTHYMNAGEDFLAEFDARVGGVGSR